MNVVKILALLAVVFITSAAIAADAPAKKGGAGLRGKVTKVDGTKITITTRAGEDKVIDTDDNTKFTLDGAAATIADVKPNARITVTPETGVATEIKITSAKGKKPASAPAT